MGWYEQPSQSNAEIKKGYNDIIGCVSSVTVITWI